MIRSGTLLTVLKNVPTIPFLLPISLSLPVIKKIAAFIIYNNEVKEGRMFDSVTDLNEWFELICSGDDKYCYPNEEIHG